MGAANTAFNSGNQVGISGPVVPKVALGVQIPALAIGESQQGPQKKKRAKKLPPQPDTKAEPAKQERSGGKPPQAQPAKNPMDVMLGVSRAPGSSYRK